MFFWLNGNHLVSFYGHLADFLFFLFFLLFFFFQVEIPRAFVCAEGKIFDVTEWATCQVFLPIPHPPRLFGKINYF